MKEEKFYLEKQVLYSDFDSSGNMRVGRLMNAFQECINAHSQAIGRGIDYMVKTGRTWYVVSWNVEIRRLPRMYERIRLSTWGYKVHLSLGSRNVLMTDAQGEVIASGDSLWSLVDINTGTPLRITDEDMTGYTIFPQYEGMTYLGRHIKTAGAFEKADSVRIRRADIDYNGHVSNDSYVGIAAEYIPEGYVPFRIRAEYKAQTKYGERTDCLVSASESGYTVMLTGEDAPEDVRCIVEFSGANP